MLNEHLEQDMPTRYVVTNSLGGGCPIWKTDLETFTVGVEDLFLHKYILENQSAISANVMYFVGLLLAAENGKSLGGFNGQHFESIFPFVPATNFLTLVVPVSITAVDLCVWDPGIGFRFMALTGYIENTEELLLLECTDKFFLIAYSNPMSRVWDPRQAGCPTSSRGSVVDNCNALTFPLIADSLVFAEYYVVKHDLCTFYTFTNDS